MPVRVGSCVRVLLAVAIVSCGTPSFRPVAAQLAVRETSLGVRPEGTVPQTVAVSAAMRLGYVVKTPAGDAVVVDGVRGRLYSDINTTSAPYIAGGLPRYVAGDLQRYLEAGRRPYLTFSPDGKRFASAAKQGERALVVVDGTAGPLFDAVHWDSQPFSPDSRHVAYVATREGNYVAVRDGVVGPAYDAIRSLEFTADSRHVIYVAQREAREYVVMDGKEVGVDERVLGTPAFSVARNRLAFRVKKGDSTLVVVDVKPGKSYATIGDRLRFTRDGRVFYSARDSLSYVVVDGVEGRGYPFIIEESLGSSENGDHVVYIAVVNNKTFWVVDGRELNYYDYVGPANGPRFSRDGARVTYAARADSVASPDGRRIAAVVGRGARWFVAVDGVVGPAYDEVWNPAFSRDSRHVAYIAKRGDKWTIVIDGAESPAYDEILGFPSSDRVGRDSLTFLARRGDEDLRVTIPWP